MEVAVEQLVIIAGITGLTLGAAGAVRLYRYLTSEERRVKRALRSVVRSSIAKAEDGVPVKIFGRVKSSRRVLEAPVSGRTCLVYDVLVERGDRDFWVSAHRDRDACEFFVEDATGRAVVRLDRSELHLDKDVSMTSTSLEPAPGRAEQYLAPLREGLGDGSVRVSEGVIQEGENVAVLGIGHWERDPDPDPKRASGYRRQARRFVMEDQPILKLHVSDDPEVS